MHFSLCEIVNDLAEAGVAIAVYKIVPIDMLRQKLHLSLCVEKKAAISIRAC